MKSLYKAYNENQQQPSCPTSPRQSLWLSTHIAVSFSSGLLLLFSHEVLSNCFVTPWTVACQASLSMGFPRQEYWSGLLFPSPGNLLDPGIKPMSPALQAYSLLLSHQGILNSGLHISKYYAYSASSWKFFLSFGYHLLTFYLGFWRFNTLSHFLLLLFLSQKI